MTDPRRRAELAKIHIGAKQVCDDTEAYRDMLRALTGKRSSADLDGAQRRLVIRHLEACGAKFHHPRRGSAPKQGSGAPSRPRLGPDVANLIRKIDALCINHPGGRKPRSYAEGILRHMTSHPHRTPLEWARPPDLVKVIQALEIDRKRHAGGAA